MNICCPGAGDEPRLTESGRAFCPTCFRPVQYKIVKWFSMEFNRHMTEIQTIRHRSDGISSGTRLGIPNRNR